MDVAILENNLAMLAEKGQHMIYKEPSNGTLKNMWVL